jgi:hypothetical protein
VKRVDDIAVAAATRRLDELAREHPELCGPRGSENRAGWMRTLRGAESMSPKSAETGDQVAFRLPAELIARIDRYAERLAASTPGIRYTRTDAVRSLLTRVLDEIEAGDKRKGK